MTTDYDPIADQYRRAKQQPWRGCLESSSVLALIGDPTGHPASGTSFSPRRRSSCWSAAADGGR
jgi:hypothetical protein